MSDTNEGHHPQDPAEGADFDEPDARENAGGRNAGTDDTENTDNTDADGTSAAAQQQNEQRELNNGDDVLEPGGDEPTD